MSRYNKGIIFSNDKCNACSKCISQCPIFGANVSVIENSKNSILVDSNKCVNCGDCIDSCPQNARDFKDDTEAFFSSLKNGEKITVMLSSGFDFYYEDIKSNFIGYLKSLGVDKIYDDSFGQEIAVWANTKYLKGLQADPSIKRHFILNNCPAVTNRIEQYYYGLTARLIPVHSSMICGAIYLHKYNNDTNKIAYIGPCVAKVAEAHSVNTNGNVDFVLTYKHIMEKITNTDITSFKGQLDELPVKSVKPLYFHGNFKEEVAQYFPIDTNMYYLEGEEEENYKLLTLQRYSQNPLSKPFFVDFLSCKNGCHDGPGIEKNKINNEGIYLKYAENLAERIKNGSCEERWENFQKQFCNLNFDDFTRKYTDKFRQAYKVPKETFDDIFDWMLKDTEEKRHIDCGSCGYKSCYEMAKAIAHGFNKRENCIHYMNSQMEINFYTDSDTGLPNKAAFNKIFSELIEKNPEKKFAVFLGDVNRLKVINDLYGFDTGTEVLKVIANSLTNVIGKNGICCRMGGGNFAICIEDTAENIKNIVELNYFDCKHLGIEFPVTVRFGVYSSSERGITPITMLNRATLCMDKQISNSQNTFTFFTDDLRKNTLQEIEITSKLQQGLENHEFVLWFQPQYDALTGELVGAEALTRWIQKDGSIISPEIFIPIAEKNGFIRKLDVEIWKMAFQTLNRWMKKNIKLIPISVNISRISLENDSLIYTIMNLSRDYEIPPRLVHFEITESAYMSDQKNMILRINKLRNLGYQIAMDDFGSGYSSLNTLKDMPIDYLKLDMGFLRGQTNMDKGGRIISSLATMAQNLEYITIAEGVETQEQADFLKSIGIDIIQGFLYSKPLQESKYIDIISTQTKVENIEKNIHSGFVEINNFYNPTSSESILFDKLMGPAAIFSYKPVEEKAQILRANDKALKIFGLEDRSFKEIQRTLKHFFTKDTLSIFYNTLDKAISTNSESICILRDRDAINNYEIFVKLTAKVVSQKDNSYIIFALMNDITDEMQIDNTIQMSESYFSALMEVSQIGMVIFRLTADLHDFSGSFKMSVLRANKEFVRTSGYTEKEVLHWTEKQSLDVIHPMDRPGFLAVTAKGYLSGFAKPYYFVYRARGKEGNYMKVKILVNGTKQEDGSYLLFTTYIPQAL